MKRGGNQFWPKVYVPNLHQKHASYAKRMGGYGKVMKAEKQYIWDALHYGDECKVLDSVSCRKNMEKRHKNLSDTTFANKPTYRKCKFSRTGVCEAAVNDMTQSLQFMRWLLFNVDGDAFNQYVKAFPHQLTEENYGYSYDDNVQYIPVDVVEMLQQAIPINIEPVAEPRPYQAKSAKVQSARRAILKPIAPPKQAKQAKQAKQVRKVRQKAYSADNAMIKRQKGIEGAELEIRLRMYEMNYEKAVLHIKELEDEIKRLQIQKKKSSGTKQIQNLQQKLEDARLDAIADANACKMQIEEISLELNELQKHNKELGAETRDCENSLDKMKQEMIQLDEEKAKHKETKMMLNALKAERDKLKSDNKYFQQEKITLESVLQSKMKERETRAEITSRVEKQFEEQLPTLSELLKMFKTMQFEIKKELSKLDKELLKKHVNDKVVKLVSLIQETQEQLKKQRNKTEAVNVLVKFYIEVFEKDEGQLYDIIYNYRMALSKKT